MDREIVNKILGITEAFELPEKLMTVMLDDEKRPGILKQFANLESDLSYDWFTDYFQNEQGDRNALKQDFTPDCLTEIIDRISGKADNIADICAGTGGVTIKKWNTNKDAFFYCEEVSKRTIPMLLLNLALRGVNGQVVHGDSLRQKWEAVYTLERDGEFSKVTAGDEPTDRKFDLVIMNPPYSLKWDDVNAYALDKRFWGYGIPPKSKADYAFVLHGISKLKNDGQVFAILPHGVLFRGAQEAEIRRALIDNDMVSAVVGLPDKLFLNTGIPVCIMQFKRSNGKTLIVDASKDFEKDKAQNHMAAVHIEKLAAIWKNRIGVDKYSVLVEKEEIAENDYNLNIPRYVDNFEKEPIPDIAEVMGKIEKLENESREIQGKLFEMLNDMFGSDADSKRGLEKMKEVHGYLKEE